MQCMPFACSPSFVVSTVTEPYFTDSASCSPTSHQTWTFASSSSSTGSRVFYGDAWYPDVLYMPIPDTDSELRWFTEAEERHLADAQLPFPDLEPPESALDLYEYFLSPADNEAAWMQMYNDYCCLNWLDTLPSDPDYWEPALAAERVQAEADERRDRRRDNDDWYASKVGFCFYIMSLSLADRPSVCAMLGRQEFDRWFKPLRYPV